MDKFIISMKFMCLFLVKCGLFSQASLDFDVQLRPLEI